MGVGAMKAKFTLIQRVPIFPMKLLWWMNHHAAWCDVQTPALDLPRVVLPRNSMNRVALLGQRRISPCLLLRVNRKGSGYRWNKSEKAT